MERIETIAEALEEIANFITTPEFEAGVRHALNNDAQYRFEVAVKKSTIRDDFTVALTGNAQLPKRQLLTLNKLS